MYLRFPEIGIDQQNASMVLHRERLREINCDERLAFGGQSACNEQRFYRALLASVLQLRAQAPELLGAQKLSSIRGEDLQAFGLLGLLLVRLRHCESGVLTQPDCRWCVRRQRWSEVCARRGCFRS